MSFTFIKQPNETVRLGHNYRNALTSGDSILSATYTVINIDSGDAVVTAGMTVSGSGKITNENPNDVPSVNNTASVQFISGDDGMEYKLSILATTASGDKYEADINVITQNN